MGSSDNAQFSVRTYSTSSSYTGSDCSTSDSESTSVEEEWVERLPFLEADEILPSHNIVFLDDRRIIQPEDKLAEWDTSNSLLSVLRLDGDITKQLGGSPDRAFEHRMFEPFCLRIHEEEEENRIRANEDMDFFLAPYLINNKSEDQFVKDVMRRIEMPLDTFESDSERYARDDGRSNNAATLSKKAPEYERHSDVDRKADIRGTRSKTVSNPMETGNLRLNILKRLELEHRALKRLDTENVKDQASFEQPSFIEIDTNEWVCDQSRQKALRVLPCDCKTSEKHRASGLPACGVSCLNRMTMINRQFDRPCFALECSPKICPCGLYCTNRKFTLKENAPMYPFKTKWKGWGVRSIRDIKSGSFVIEYVGEIIDEDTFLQRLRDYEQAGQRNYYFMSLDRGLIIDATLKGNFSRLINHSCDPNCTTQKWNVYGRVRIGIFACKDISAGSELTFDYKYETLGMQNTKCFCQSSNCRSVLGSQCSNSIWLRKTSTMSNERCEQSDCSSSDRSASKKRFGRSNNRIQIPKTLQKPDEIHQLLNTTVVLARLFMASVRSSGLRVCILNFILGISDSDPSCLKLFVQYGGINVLSNWLSCRNAGKRSSRALRLRIVELLERLPIICQSEYETSKIIAMLSDVTFLVNPNYNKTCSDDDISTSTSNDDVLIAAILKSLVDKVDKLLDAQALNLIERVSALGAKWAKLPYYPMDCNKDDEKNSDLIDVNSQCLLNAQCHNNVRPFHDFNEGLNTYRNLGFMVPSMPQYMIDQIEQTIPRPLPNGAYHVTRNKKCSQKTDIKHRKKFERFLRRSRTPSMVADSCKSNNGQHINDAMSEDSDSELDDRSANRTSIDDKEKSIVSFVECRALSQPDQSEEFVVECSKSNSEHAAKTDRLSNTIQADATNCYNGNFENVNKTKIVNSMEPRTDDCVYSTIYSESSAIKQHTPEHGKYTFASPMFIQTSSPMVRTPYSQPSREFCQPAIVSQPPSVVYNTFPQSFSMPNPVILHRPCGSQNECSYPIFQYHNRFSHHVMPPQMFRSSISRPIASNNLTQNGGMCFNRFPVYPNLTNFPQHAMFNPYHVDQHTNATPFSYGPLVTRVPSMVVGSTCYPTSQLASRMMMSPAFRGAQGYYPYAMQSSNRQFTPSLFQPLHVPTSQFAHPLMPAVFAIATDQGPPPAPTLCRNDCTSEQGHVDELYGVASSHVEHSGPKYTSNKSPSPKRVRVDSTATLRHITYHKKSKDETIQKHEHREGRSRWDIPNVTYTRCDTTAASSNKIFNDPGPSTDPLYTSPIVTSEPSFLGERMSLDKRIQMHLERESSVDKSRAEATDSKVKCPKYSRLARLKKLRARAIRTRFQRAGSNVFTAEKGITIQNSRELNPDEVRNMSTPHTVDNSPALAISTNDLENMSVDCVNGRVVKQFKTNLSKFIMGLLGPYRQKSCVKGRINTHEDFKYLARKFTHAILEKEIERCHTTAGSNLELCKRVKVKTRVYIEKYMNKCLKDFYRRNDSRECV